MAEPLNYSKRDTPVDKGFSANDREAHKNAIDFLELLVESWADVLNESRKDFGSGTIFLGDITRGSRTKINGEPSSSAVNEAIEKLGENYTGSDQEKSMLILKQIAPSTSDSVAKFVMQNAHQSSLLGYLFFKFSSWLSKISDEKQRKEFFLINAALSNKSSYLNIDIDDSGTAHVMFGGDLLIPKKEFLTNKLKPIDFIEEATEEMLKSIEKFLKNTPESMDDVEVAKDSATNEYRKNNKVDHFLFSHPKLYEYFYKLKVDVCFDVEEIDEHSVKLCKMTITFATPHDINPEGNSFLLLFLQKLISFILGIVSGAEVGQAPGEEIILDDSIGTKARLLEEEIEVGQIPEEGLILDAPLETKVRPLEEEVEDPEILETPQKWMVMKYINSDKKGDPNLLICELLKSQTINVSTERKNSELENKEAKCSDFLENCSAISSSNVAQPRCI